VQAVQQAKPEIDSDVAARRLARLLDRCWSHNQRARDPGAGNKRNHCPSRQYDTLAAESEEHKAQLGGSQGTEASDRGCMRMKCRSWTISEEEAERKRQAKELIEKFHDYADKVAEEAVQRKREELGKAHDEEIKKLKQLTDVADAERKECRTALAVGNSWSCDAKAAGRFPDTEWWVIRARQKKVCGFVSSIVEIAFKMPGNTVL